MINLTNEKIRRKQILRMRKSNKSRKTALRLNQRVLRNNDLIKEGWSSKEVTALKRYLKLAFEIRTIERAYKQALEHMSKNLFPEVLEKAKAFTGDSILLNEELLLNVIEKGRTSASAEDLADKLKEKFGDILTQYNIKLSDMIEEIKKENYFTYFQFDIDKLQEGIIDNIVNKIQNTFKKFKNMLSNLFDKRDELENIMEKMVQNESNKFLESYVSLYL